MRTPSFGSITALILLLLLSACAGSLLPDPLDGTAWKLDQINGMPTLQNSIVTAEFTQGKVGGSSSCNSYGGSYKINGRKFTAESIAMTLMACVDAGVMEQEQAFLEILQNAQSFEIKDDQLLIFSSEGKSLSFSQNP